MSYSDIIESLCNVFPSPVKNLKQDAYLIATFMRALDQVTNLKDKSPILKGRRNLDYSHAKTKKVKDEPFMDLETLTSELVSYLEGMTIWGHPRTQENVIPQPSIPSLVGMMLAGLYNPILAWDEYSQKVALAEVEVVAMMADLIGYDPERASGIFTFGGTGTILYGMKVAIEKAIPGAMKKGVNKNSVIFVSEHAHYCADNVAGWLGLGTDSLIKVRTDDNHEMDVKDLQKKANAACEKGQTIVGFICTMGTTDHFGIDDLKEVVAIRDALVKKFKLNYHPHIHADAVIGWVWSVFKDYFGKHEDYDPLDFKKSTAPLYRSLAIVTRKIKNLKLADSIGVDFHKTGFTPCVSSLVLFKNQQSKDGKVMNDLNLLRRDQKKMPYLYQFSDYHPGEYTLETTRSALGVLAALANFKLFGKEGFQALIAHMVDMRLQLTNKLHNDAHISVLNKNNFGTVTLFRIYPDDVRTPIIDKELSAPGFGDMVLYYNAYNNCIERFLRSEAKAGRGILISKTDSYRTTTYTDETFNESLPVVALKSFILSPFIDDESVALVVNNVEKARQYVNKDMVISELNEHLKRTFFVQDKNTLDSVRRRIADKISNYERKS